MLTDFEPAGSTGMMQTHGVGWTMANGWPVPGETSSVTLAQEIGAALENPDVTMGLKKAFSEKTQDASLGTKRTNIIRNNAF